MPKVHSHYENLKVARDASPEAIRAAYRVLTRQYHPDRNPGDARAERVMAMINVAYEALSDPARKAEHDLWIQRAEAVSARPSQARPSVRSTAAKRATVTPTPARKPDRGPLVAAHITRYRLAYAVVGSIACALALVVALTHGPRGVDAMADNALLPLAQRDAGYLRPATAPNGTVWPSGSGYIEGYAHLNETGLSEVTIDNSLNDSDMFVKLVSLAGTTNLAVRTMFVAAHARFSITALSAGPYDLRYRNLANGTLSRSQAFILEDVSQAAGVAPRNTLTLPLYKGDNDYMKAYSLIDADF